MGTVSAEDELRAYAARLPVERLLETARLATQLSVRSLAVVTEILLPGLPGEGVPEGALDRVLDRRDELALVMEVLELKGEVVALSEVRRLASVVDSVVLALGSIGGV